MKFRDYVSTVVLNEYWNLVNMQKKTLKQNRPIKGELKPLQIYVISKINKKILTRGLFNVFKIFITAKLI